MTVAGTKVIQLEQISHSKRVKAAQISSPRPTVIRIEQVSKRYGGGSVMAVEEVSFAVEKGEILALLGPSGCGKTTTLRLIAGFEAPDSGRIEIGGRMVAHDTVFLPPEQRGVGMVFQSYALFPHLTVLENVAFGLRQWSGEQQRDRIAEALDLVGLSKLEGRYPHELSGGQQQRVALARALAPSPQVVLLDEPFSNLDADMRAQMREDVRSILRQAGTTAIFVTHDQEEAFVIADQVGVLNHGHLEQLDHPEAIYHTPASRFVARFVGSADFIPGLIQGERITTELGILPNQRGLSGGQAVEVMIRPDDIDLIPDQAGKAIVLTRQFRGADNLYCVRLPSGQKIHSSQDSTRIIEPGTLVVVKANPTHVVCFDINGVAQ
ncbi:MAG: ABC transporter ATP-binding protein [Candidatus Methylomirabilis oxygeniifera]|uniref:Putative ABC transporter (ATP binding protein) n=1 Tax=Methylomirabilis oxygeniifera TaxID=671143 RepID=D5MLS3_METO1|nr:MAG: ABC transporter ATP-binding protein [Candidatus Methylomirabilis oxyfera]CBE69980.1 Putative ABC transporter (ATP binding protein) [Candidatus Methylomirabilis oxyfera]